MPNEFTGILSIWIISSNKLTIWSIIFVINNNRQVVQSLSLGIYKFRPKVVKYKFSQLKSLNTFGQLATVSNFHALYQSVHHPTEAKQTKPISLSDLKITSNNTKKSR